MAGTRYQYTTSPRKLEPDVQRNRNKKQRKLKGFTQEKLAEASNYNLSFIGNLESSKVFQTISVGSLYHLAKILGVSIKTFFDDIDNDKN